MYLEQSTFLNDRVIPNSGKNINSLRYSRQQRDEILRRFHGNLPMSIMKAEIKPRDNDPASGTYRKSSPVDPNSPLAEIFDVSGQSVRSGALSMFPQNIGRAVLLLYSQEGDIVVDPFAGHNSRMELCVKENRHYIGYDISQSFMTYNQSLASELRDDYNTKIHLYLGDSRDMKMIANAIGDFTLTSPPYYDLEDYGNEPEQLGKAHTYKEFLVELGKVARENFRCLKDGAFCVWFVNDFRRRGVFYLYHIDVLKLLTEAGFIPWDLMIVDLGYPIRAAFATQIVEQKILPKRHEYGLIMQKPN